MPTTSIIQTSEFLALGYFKKLVSNLYGIFWSMFKIRVMLICVLRAQDKELKSRNILSNFVYFIYYEFKN